MREYYERQFPEIKKMREDKIRDSRLTRTTKNDLESDPSGTEDTVPYFHFHILGFYVIFVFQQLELDKYQRNAVMVPMLLDAKDRSRHFHDRNRLVENCARDYKESVSNSFWTQEEKDIFKEKYLQRPKDFGFISSFLKRKVRRENCAASGLFFNFVVSTIFVKNRFQRKFVFEKSSNKFSSFFKRNCSHLNVCICCCFSPSKNVCSIIT